MKLLVRSDKGRGLVIGWCPDRRGSPQAILLMEDGRLDYASVTTLSVLNDVRKRVKHLAEDSSPDELRH